MAKDFKSLGLDLSVVVRPDEEEPEEEAVVDDEEAATSEFQRIEAAKEAGKEAGKEEEKRTMLHNPSVAGMLDKFTEPEVAVVQSPHLGPIKAALVDINECLGMLKRISDNEERRLNDALEEAKQCNEAAGDVLQAVPEDEEQIAGPRAELADLRVALQRVILQRTPKPPPSPTQEAAVKAVDLKLEASAQALTKSNRRRNILFAVVALLFLGRLAMLSGTDVPKERTENRKDRDGVVAINHLAGATEKQLSTGTPSVMEVRLTQAPNGDLEVWALPFDPNGDKVELTYRWLKDGHPVELESQGRLLAQNLAIGAKYQVMVTASDGVHRSDPVTTLPIEAAKQSGRGKAVKPTAKGGAR